MKIQSFVDSVDTDIKQKERRMDKKEWEWDENENPIHYLMAACAAHYTGSFVDEEKNLEYRLRFARWLELKKPELVDICRSVILTLETNPRGMNIELELLEKELVKNQQLMKYISDTPVLLSLLYDLCLMPEQVKINTQDWRRMMTIADWHLNCGCGEKDDSKFN